MSVNLNKEMEKTKDNKTFALNITSIIDKQKHLTDLCLVYEVHFYKKDNLKATVESNFTKNLVFSKSYTLNKSYT